MSFVSVITKILLPFNINVNYQYVFNFIEITKTIIIIIFFTNTTNHLQLYIYNNIMLTFDTLEKQILIELIFFQWIRYTYGKILYGFDVFLSLMISPTFNMS